MRSRWVVFGGLVAGLGLVACAAPDGWGGPGTRVGGLCDPVDGGAADAGSDAKVSQDAGADVTGPPPEVWVAPPLPPCDAACDRVVRCAVDGCEGFSWVNAGALTEQCLDTCGAGLSAEVEAAADCGAVLDAARTRMSGFEAACERDPCLEACEHFAGCITQECEAVGADFAVQMKLGCHQGCTPAQAEQILAVTSCETLVGYVEADSPDFAQQCHGPPPSGTCAGPELCEPYADKVAACMVDHCGDPMAPWEDGLRAALRSYCLEAADCPPPAAVAYVVSEAVTCDTAPLDEVGPAPPFTAMCEGTVGATAAELEAGCAKILACPGGEGLGSAEACSVLLAMQPGAGTRAACLLEAEGCPAVYACLEGL